VVDTVTTDTSIVIPSVTTTVTNDMLIMYWGDNSSSHTVTGVTPSGATLDVDYVTSGLARGGGFWHETIAAAGATGTRSLATQTNNTKFGIALAFKPAAVSRTPAGIGFAGTSGTGTTKKVARPVASSCAGASGRGVQLKKTSSIVASSSAGGSGQGIQLKKRSLTGSAFAGAAAYRMPKVANPVGTAYVGASGVGVQLKKRSLTASGFAGASGQADAPAATFTGNYPHDLLGLVHFRWQSPENSSGVLGTIGDAAANNIPSSPSDKTTILDYADSPWFTLVSNPVAASAYVQMRAPALGSTTASGASAKVRSELRELDYPTNNAVSAWDANAGGPHVAYIRTMVTQVVHATTHNDQVCIAQCHRTTSDGVLFYYDDTLGQLKWKLNSVINAGNAGSYTKGTWINIALVVNAHLCDIYVNGVQKASGLDLTTGDSDTACYFKAGCYNLTNPSDGDSNTDYSEVHLNGVQVGHGTAYDPNHPYGASGPGVNTVLHSPRGYAFGGSGVSAVARKSVSLAAVGSVGTTGHAAATHVAKAAGLTSAGSLGSAVTLKAASSAGLATTGTVGRAAALKSVSRAGLSVAGTVGRSTMAHVAARLGVSCAGATGLSVALHKGKLTGQATAGGAPSATRVPTKTPVGSAFAGPSGRSVALHKALPSGMDCAAGTTSGVASHRAPCSGLITAGSIGRGVALHKALLSGMDCAAGTTHAVALHRAPRSGLVTAGVVCVAVATKSRSLAGVAVAGPVALSASPTSPPLPPRTQRLVGPSPPCAHETAVIDEPFPVAGGPLTVT
jgi:hypothetical protein